MSDIADKKTKSKNDIAWEKLFEKYSILDEITQKGSFQIDSSKINEFRESRLMAKFDHSANLPKIFKDHQLSILPISRSKYIIGHFDTYLNVKYDQDLESTHVDFPKEIETIDYTNLSSESSVLICAFNTGIIENLLDTNQVFYTVYGRMSTGDFQFSIRNKKNQTYYDINVDSSQCEIDAGFESEKYFLIVEAKMYDVDDFLVRQLYYPYRLWTNKIPAHKQVIPVLMTYSNSSNIFKFFIYGFDDVSDYNSIKLVKQKNYVISPESISREEISNIFAHIDIISEPDVPFPQADKFERVVDLLTILRDKELTKDEITANYQFDIRQTDYYTAAARYLGLINKYLNSGEIVFRLTTVGSGLITRRHKLKILKLIQKILEHEVFYKTFSSTLIDGKIPTKDEICEIMSGCKLDINGKTIIRRSSTVRGWIEWILSMISDK